MTPPKAKILPIRGERTVAVLDVGTSKVVALIAMVGSDGLPRVIGVGQRACAGLRRGLVVSMEQTEAAIRGAMEQAERNAGVQAEEVFVSLSAGGLASHVEHVEIEIGGQRISTEDMDTLTRAGRNAIEPGTRTVLHASPALYTLDGLQGVETPVGFHADRLGLDVHVVTAETPPTRNLDLVVRSSDLGVRVMVASPVASSLACLAREERELGVALVEIGAGVTNIAVHFQNQLVGVATVAMGANDITNDIAAAFATKRVHAERLKNFKGAAIGSPKDNHEILEIMPISDDDNAEPGRVPAAQLIAVIRTRLDALFGEVAKALTTLGYTGPQARQVVLTGGGAELKAIADFAQGALGRSVRLGRPRGLTGLPDAQSGCAFATLAGLALFAAQDVADLYHVRGVKTPLPNLSTGKIGGMFAKLKNSI